MPVIHRSREDAIQAWNRRRGLASLGGRATRGLQSPRKAEAAKRNLAKARQVRQLNRIKQASDAAYDALRPYRELEIAEAEAEVAKDRAELRQLEPRIARYPDLKSLYEWMKSRWANLASGGQEAI